MDPDDKHKRFRIGDLIVDAGSRRVTRRGRTLAVPGLSFDLLLALARRAPDVVSVDTLMDEVWPGLVVGPETVTKRVQLLRDALDDRGEHPRYLSAIRGRGYRLHAPVQPERSAPVGRSRRRAMLATAVCGSLLAAAAVVAILHDSRETDVSGPRAIDALNSAPSPPAASTSAPSLPSRTIAVLPFLNLSADASREYLATGIAEAVLHQLAGLRDMTVIARTSSFAFKDEEDVREIGRKLNARYLLEGSVQSAEDRLRVTAQLIDAATGGHVWSLSFDRTPDDIFAVQDEIALKLAESFELSLDAGARDRLSATPPDLEAYQHYLIGREILHKREHDFPELAIEQFSRAIAIDPRYAEAHAELAVMSALRAGWDSDLDDRQQQADRAQEAIDTALALKPGLARAYVAQGLLLANRDPPDYPHAEAMLRKALVLEPNMVDASNWLATTLQKQGRYDEALAMLERTARIDPLASPVIDNLAMAHASRGDFVRAEQMLRRRLELPQPSAVVRWTLFDLYSVTGRFVEANAVAKGVVLNHAEAVGRGLWSALLSASYAQLGLWDSAVYWIERNEQEAPDDSGLEGVQLLRQQGRYEEMAAALPATPAHTAPDYVSSYGTMQALAGDHREAIQTLEPVVDPDAPNGFQVMDFADAHHALAWAYMETGATDRAQKLLQQLDRRFQELQTEGWLHLSSDLGLFAQNALLAGDEDLALDRLRQAIDAGWRDYYSVRHDPRWQSLSDNPRFKTLLETVKVDIDAQRARIEQIDAGDDFVARLDKVLEDTH